ncbi:MAG: helix-turn-helix transcriptional regulator [Clostridia bacterium]|nr:helix-turn-helix transcriptional regulator [Clostridia bacterium]
MSETDIPLTETVFYLLLVLQKPRHGYGIIQEVESLTDGRVVLGAGTLYGALKTLSGKKWIRPLGSPQGPRGRKEYEITGEGRAVLHRETDRLRQALRNAENMGDGK